MRADAFQLHYEKNLTRYFFLLEQHELMKSQGRRKTLLRPRIDKIAKDNRILDKKFYDELRHDDFKKAQQIREDIKSRSKRKAA